MWSVFYLFVFFINLQYNCNDLNTDGLFTVEDSISFSKSLESLSIAQDNKYLGIFYENFLILSWKCTLCILITISI